MTLETHFTETFVARLAAREKQMQQHDDLVAQRLPGSSHWKIPLSSVLAFEEGRAEHERLTAEWSRELDAMGAPPE
jgi:hypothetical protein